MAASRERAGRPMQFHGVLVEERALDSQGNRLPWALEWANGHPNARHQKRQVEEKGPFGKSLQRRGPSARSTRTQTPAKKENPTLDGFEAALKFDTQRRGPGSQLPNAKSSIAQQSSQSSQSVVAEPTAIKIFGYSPETQYAAIDFYEKVSGGTICEDYDRRPPPGPTRFGLGATLIGTPPRRRPLTPTERHAAAQYAGGRCWVKVTFDSRAAADRAMASSPHVLHGHWVYAQPYHGQAPVSDEPIPHTNDDLVPPDTLGGPQPHAPLSATRGREPRPGAGSGFGVPSPSTSTSDTLQSSSTLNPDKDAQASPPAEPLEIRSPTSASTSSALVPTSDALAPPAQPRQRHFSHFPDTPVTQLHDASEALLPSPSWIEWALSTLRQSGLFPGDFIGSTVPRSENGDFDWDASSFYWRVCFMLDTYLGTDLCGLKDS